MKRLTKVSPLLLLVLLSAIGAMAAYIMYWQSGVITSQHGFTVTGLTGAAIQIPDGSTNSAVLIGNYEGLSPALTLGSFTTGTAPPLTATRAFVLAYDSGNTDLSNGLVIKLDVTFTGLGAEDITYSATGKYLLVYYNKATSAKGLSFSTAAPVTFVDGVVTIPYSKLGLITYDKILPQYGVGDEVAKAADANCLIIEFTFSGGGGSIDPTSWGNYVAGIEIVASLGMNTGA